MAKVPNIRDTSWFDHSKTLGEQSIGSIGRLAHYITASHMTSKTASPERDLEIWDDLSPRLQNEYISLGVRISRKEKGMTIEKFLDHLYQHINENGYIK